MAIRFFSKSETHREFSNFAAFPIEIDGWRWPSVEHFYQAQKFTDPALHKRIRELPNAPAAKNFADKNKAHIRPDWDAVKDDVMLRAARAKFGQHAPLREMLLATGDEELIESAPTDYYWGEGRDGTGQNKLGRILERVRAELRSGAAPADA
jgi:ribA/ribD-fused uncharacterized protein